MATLCYGVLDPVRGRMEISVAGHPPPLLVQPGRSAEFVDTRPAPPIGADVSSRYSSTIVDLEPGATLVLFTDGLVERRGETLDVGLKRLVDAMRYAPPLLDAACDRLLNRLVGDEHPDDDVALLGLRFVGTGRRHLRLRRPARADELAPVRRVLAAWLETAGVDPEDIGSIVVAVSEAATNAIEHAYGPAEGWFEVEADVEEGPLVTVVVRRGTVAAQGTRRRRARPHPHRATCRRLRASPPARRNRNMDASRSPWEERQRMNGMTGLVQVVERHDGVVPVCALKGELDASNVEHVLERLTSYVGNDAPGLALDLAATSYLDSAGVRILFELARRLRSRRQELRIAVPSTGIVRARARTHGAGRHRAARRRRRRVGGGVALTRVSDAHGLPSPNYESSVK